ncbi:MAG TPA: RNA-guided pseudouridylation complex pseudouridine synthase subunit Cbf5 [Candidatus Nanopusillus sp.]|nr:RNA-guided pseudouridylation complex pseudouridine synthase subunit Cbf5 [Candidatus Nanopusillus sp.]HIP89976.1 RNA-guided pseudouridylation complex pseudouridine synthase subunit Cbf5 [Candidatus Nanopusillus sp.]
MVCVLPEDQKCWLPYDKEDYEILVKREAETDLRYGYDPWKRPVEYLLDYSVINLDKPKGPTSHQVTAWVKQIVGKKAGHGGTLDPKVTGVLPIGIGRATKVLQLFLTAGKEYVVWMHLHKEIEPEKVIAVLEKFEGEIIQKPPLKSAVKKRPRKKKVYCIKVLEIDGKDWLLRISTEAGVYIRKLIHDIGRELGIGAHMQQLRRTRVGALEEDSNKYPLVTLQDVVDALWFWKNEENEKYLRKVFLPPEVAAEHWKKIWVVDTAVEALVHGANLTVRGISKLYSNINQGDWVAIFTLKNELVGIGKSLMSSSEIMEADRGIAVDIERVFLKKGFYPKKWKSKSKE